MNICVIFLILHNIKVQQIIIRYKLTCACTNIATKVQKLEVNDIFIKKYIQK